MWKLILVIGILWFLWSRWTKFWRDTLSQLTINAARQQANRRPFYPDSETSEQSTEQSREDFSPSRVVKCERCGVYVPMNEVKQASEFSNGNAQYICIQPCTPANTKDPS